MLVVSVIFLQIFQIVTARVVHLSTINSINDHGVNIHNSFKGVISNNFIGSINITDKSDHNVSDGGSHKNDDDYDYELECEVAEMPPSPESMCCGVDVSSDDRVLGGSPTLLNQYPWLTLIEYLEDHKLRPKCGGSLISSRYVLTAGHCVSGSILETSKPVNVVLGDYDYKHKGRDCILENGEKVCSDGEVRIPINRIIVHELYNDDHLTHDIALVKLSKVAPFTDSIRPICLPTLDLTRSADKNLWLTIAGWGHAKQTKSKDGEYNGKMSNVKRHLQMPYVPLENCSRTWSITKNHQLICAGGLPGQDACMGDSGGPLMYNNEGQYQLAGIISFGADDPCGKPGVPGAYTNVFKYYKWIMNAIQRVK